MTSEVIVTKHAISRFRERFRLMFHSEIFRDRKESFLMKTLFEKATSVDFSLKQKPGLYNAICIRNGCKVDYHRFSDKVIFVSTVDSEGKRFILTALRTDHKVMDRVFP
jgi:hypothetical protein